MRDLAAGGSLYCATSSSSFTSAEFPSERKGEEGEGEDPVCAFCSICGLKAGSFCCVPNWV